MATHHYPSLPVGVMQLIVRWAVFDGNSKYYGFQRAVFSFINQNAFPPGWTPVTYPPTLMDPWITNAFFNTVPVITADPQYWWFLQSPTNFYGVPYFWNWGPNVNGYAASPALCACYTKLVHPTSKHNTGRMHLMPVPKNFLDLGTYRASALSLYTARVTNLMAPINFDGVIFSPALFSPALGTYSTIDEIRFVERPCYLYRRRAGKTKIAPLWTYVP